MNKLIKEVGRILLASSAMIGIIMFPVIISLIFYYSAEYLTKIGICSSYPQDIYSYCSGSIVSSVIMFFFLIFLLGTKRLKMDTEERSD